MICPICERKFLPAESVSLPFCSPRCQQIDLGRWLSEGYSLPEDPEAEDPDQDGDDSRGWSNQHENN